MTCIFISSYSIAKIFYKNRFSYNYKLVITDKISVRELFQSYKIKCILLSSQIKQKEHNNIFKKSYNDFHNLLIKLDKKSKKINKQSYNLSFYNTFRHLGNKDYAGAKIIEICLNRIIKKYKIKKIIFFGEIEGSIFKKNFFINIIINKSKNKNVIIESLNHKFLKDNQFLKTTKKFFQLTHIKIYFLKFLYLVKIVVTKLNILKSRENNILLVEPLFDLIYFPYRINKTFICNNLYFNNTETSKDIILKKKNLSKFTDSNTLESYLHDLINQNNEYFEKKMNYMKNIVIKKDIKKIFIGCDPEPILANILKQLKKLKVKIYGLQHGGGYLIQDYDLEHLDSDYNFCDKFLSYGSSKKISKKIKKRIINTGSFKTTYYENLFSNDDKKIKDNNILFIPNEIATALNPTVGMLPDERFLIQKKICKHLSLLNKNIFLKVLDNHDWFPLINYLSGRNKNFKFDFTTVNQCIKRYKPKIIILDYIGTTLYESLYSNANIILFLDKNNMPKSDVLKILKKRVFFVKNFNEFKKKFSEIEKSSIKNDNTFLNEFFRLKPKYMNKIL